MTRASRIHKTIKPFLLQKEKRMSYNVTISAVNTISTHNGAIEKLGETTRKIGSTIFSKDDIAFIDTEGNTLISGAMSFSFEAKSFKETEASWLFVREDGVKATFFKNKGLVVQILDSEGAEAEEADEEEDEAPVRGKKAPAKKAAPAKKGKKVVEEEDTDEEDADEEDEEEEDTPPAKKGKAGKKVESSDFDWDD